MILSKNYTIIRMTKSTKSYHSHMLNCRKKDAAKNFSSENKLSEKTNTIKQK